MSDAVDAVRAAARDAQVAHASDRTRAVSYTQQTLPTNL
jgi:hypothetical protein